MANFLKKISLQKSCDQAHESDKKTIKKIKTKELVAFVMTDVKVMQSAVFGFNVINIIYGIRYIVSYM